MLFYFRSIDTQGANMVLENKVWLFGADWLVEM
jgi:hypothetical protein